MVDRVFDASQGVFVNQIAGGPDHKKVPDVLVEYDFGSCAGVRAAENNGKRMLRLGGLRAPGGGGFAFGDFAAGKTGVAFFEFGERGIRAANRTGRIRELHSILASRKLTAVRFGAGA